VAKLSSRAIHPGHRLARQIRDSGLTQTELARAIRVPVNRITRILNGTRNITAETAVRLGHYFGNAPEFWLNLQGIHDIQVVEEKEGKTIRGLPRFKRR
jgi:addiction module HigA family antidote